MTRGVESGWKRPSEQPAGCGSQGHRSHPADLHQAAFRSGWLYRRSDTEHRHQGRKLKSEYVAHVLPGGGVSLLRANKALEKLKGENDDQKTGIEIVKKAITWPARQIAINSGEDGSVIIGKILEKEAYTYGFDAQHGEFGNLVSKGIIDPTKVVRHALQDAASVAGLLITTEAMVAELPKKKAPPMPGGPGGGMGDMDF